MGNIGSQSGHLKYKPTNTENLQWPHSFPRTQPRFQQDQLKVLPEKTPKIRLRHTENGEILQTGGTLTGRQIQSKFGENREIKKCGSEPHLHNLINSHQSDSFELDRDRKFRKKYRAPPPPNQGGKSNEISANNWENKKNTPPKPRLFKTKIQTERKRSVPDYHEKSDYFEVPHRSLQQETTPEKDTDSYPPPSHRISLPALNIPSWDFQGELKEATRRLRKIRTDENDEFFSTSENNLYEATKREKLKTLDHHINRRDLIKLKSTNVIKNDGIPPPPFIRSEASGKESSIEESPSKSKNEKKSEAPKQFYFGMSSQHQVSTSPKIEIEKINSKFKENSYSDSDSSSDIKHNGFDSDIDLQLKTIIPKKAQDLQRLSPITKWKQSSSAESVMHPVAPKEYKYSSEENEELPRIFSIFPVRSRSIDRSGDSGISGDGSPAVYEDSSDPVTGSKHKLLSTIPGWTPQQDLGDDSSFEEESLSVEDYNETFDTQSNQQHVFSLSLPREHYLPSFETLDQNPNETNFEKIRRSVSGILNTINRKEAESTPENEKGNWFLNKSCTTLNSSNIQTKYAQISDELDEFLSRNSKHNTGRVMYLPKPDKYIRPRRYEARNKQKNAKNERKYIQSENINQNKSISVPENLQDSPMLNERKTFKKKPKRFTFQSTIRQIERRRIAEKLSREAERKEQQRLRELEVMQKVEKEFQKKRAREKVNIKQQLSRYTYENSRSVSPSTITPMSEALHARSEPDGAVSSSPTSSLNQSDDKPEQTKFFKKNSMDNVNNNTEYKSCSEGSEDNRSKGIMQTQVLSEYRQPQREYRDYQLSKKHIPEGVDNQRQTTIHPKVTYKMPKSKGMSRSGSNNYRKDFACGIRAKAEASRSQQQVQTRSSPNKYYSQFGPLTRF
ncbi:hypothetical protein WA026_004702 [Henosepilachna vigintioctopunctata]|uniref:Uncharacterized protein n=1 Tax=Henosepilachna vigintioctopunctata TaxID=420089 RepID=A0AAW1V2X2_9CUCU